jgi:PAS domain S-box-containing protein
MTRTAKLPDFSRNALQITLLYAVVGSAWIAISDIVLEQLGVTVYQLTRFSTMKGLLFIGTTAAILHYMIKRLLLRISVQQTALQASEQRLMLALEATGDGVWDWDILANSCFYSSGWKQILGYDEHEIGSSLEEFESRVHPDDSDRFKEALRAHLVGEKLPYNHQFRLRCRNGSYKWIQKQGRIVAWDDDGKPLRMLGTMRDISAQKKAEEGLRQQSELLQALFRATPFAVCLFDRDDRITLWNPGAANIFGWSAEDVIGRQLPIESAETAQEHAALLARVKRGEAFDELERSYLRKDGSRVHIRLSTAPLRDGNGRINGVVAIASDITQKKRAEKEVLRLQEFHALILDAIHTGVWVADNNDVVTYTNHGIETISEMPADQILGTNILKDLPEKNYGQFLSIYRQIREEEEPVNYEAVMVQTPTGRTSYRSGWLIPLFSEGKYAGTICTVEDITDRIQAERESARYQEQLRTMGSMRALDEELQRHQLATSLHDGIGQILALARIKLSALRASLSQTGEDDRISDLQETLDEAISATRSLTMEISPPILFQIGLEAALEGLVETFRNRHGLPVTYREEGLHRPLSEETRIFLYQSTRELLMNALKHAHADTVVVSCEFRGKTIVITVTDDGIGFTAPAPGRMPDSYGLFSIAERMHHIGAKVELASVPGQGTKIELVAPINVQ